MSKLEKIINGFKYVADFDYDSHCQNCEGSWFDCGSVEENEVYAQRFRSGEISTWLVSKLKQCGSCNNWHEVETIHDLHCDNAEESIEVFMDMIGVFITV